MTLNTDKIKQLMALIQDTDIAEIEICDGEQSIRLARFSKEQSLHKITAPATPVAVETAKTEPAQAPTTPTGHTIHSPMVGIFYAAPAPEAPAFVEVGQQVKKGQVLCIIEAMKMMNQIEADRAGKISAKLAENGQPVEFGQPLFIIE